MKTYTLLASFTGMMCVAALGQDKITKAIENWQITKAFIETLTHDDVPAKWRSKVTKDDTDEHVVRTYYRGSQKVLMVMWAKKWVGEKERAFCATVYDGEQRVSEIVHIGDGTSVMSPRPESGYSQIVSLADSGGVQVMATSEDGFLEIVKVAGRETCLTDDLEYTKAAIASEQIIAPLMDAVERELAKPARKARKKKERKKSRAEQPAE